MSTIVVHLALEVPPVEVVLGLHCIGELSPACILQGVMQGYMPTDCLVHGERWDGFRALAEPFKAGIMHGILLILGWLALGPFKGSLTRWVFLATDCGLRKWLQWNFDWTYLYPLHEVFAVCHLINNLIRSNFNNKDASILG